MAEERIFTDAEIAAAASALRNSPDPLVRQLAWGAWEFLAETRLPAAQGPDESGWVIEGAAVYWEGRFPESFTADINEAVRFARRCDAERVLSWIIPEPMRVLCRTAEHVWVDVPKEPSRPRVPCPECEGKGKIPETIFRLGETITPASETEAEEIRKVLGDDAFRECPRCNGSGIVPAPEGCEVPHG